VPVAGTDQNFFHNKYEHPTPELLEHSPLNY